MIRPVWFTCGAIALALGAIGLALPLLPTVPFLLLAAFCFARTSQRLNDWLLDHRAFGPPIKNWNERGAISWRTKWISSASMVASLGLSVLFRIPEYIIIIQLLTLIGVAVFIWTRPNA